MQERRFRPGDVLDDYCPRERRITDHAVVAMIDGEIRQTRCVSCDTEHEYKHARVPAQRRRKADAALFNQVLEGLATPAARLASRRDDAPSDESSPEPDRDRSLPPGDLRPDAPVWSAPAVETASPVEAVSATDAAEAEPDTESEAEGEAPGDALPDEGAVRRRLFRAQLPRHEGQQVPTRTLPEFTIRQPGAGRGRPGQGQGQGQGHPRGQGRRRGGGQQQGGGQPARFGQRGQGSGRGTFGQGPGKGQGQGGRRRRGKKR